MAQAVLSIPLPQSLDQIRSMINDINKLFSSVTSFQDNLKKLKEHVNTTQDLLRRAQEAKSVPENPRSIGTDRVLYWTLWVMYKHEQCKFAG